MQKADLVRRLREGKLPAPNKDNQINESCVFIQQKIRGILGRLTVDKMRTDEERFLGMKTKVLSRDEMKNDPVVIAEQKRLERKNVQEGNWKQYQSIKENVKKEIDLIQGNDFMQDMLKERHDWVSSFKSQTNKIPEEIKPFYDRFNEEDELEAKRQAELEAKARKKKKADAKKKGKKGKEDEEEEEKTSTVKIGNSEIIQKFDEQYGNYNKVWALRDESNNFDQRQDTNLTKEEMMPELINEYTGLIDSMINTELENMRLLVGTSKKKKKGKKKNKKKKKKKKKSLNLPGYKYIKDMDREELLTKLI